MKMTYTDFAKNSLNNYLLFLIEQGATIEKVLEIQERVFEKVNMLSINPYLGQVDVYILDKKHRRLIEGNYKIVYRIENDVIYITDVFDARQDPDKMNRSLLITMHFSA